MTSVDHFKNLPAELHYLIFGELTVPILAFLRRLNKDFSQNTCLLTLVNPHEARMRFEKIVFSAKPFFPKKLMKRTRSMENKLFSNQKTIGDHSANFKSWNLANKEIGSMFLHPDRNGNDLGEEVYWVCECRIPNEWVDFFSSLDDVKPMMQKHCRDFKVDFECSVTNDYPVLCWITENCITNKRSRRQTESFHQYAKYLGELQYVNAAKIETQFWAVYGIVNQWSPKDFFASTQMFF